MAHAFLQLERNQWSSHWKEQLRTGLDALLAKDHKVTLFRSEDWVAWVTFSAVFLVLLIFDNAVLHRNPKAMTITKACVYTVFWILCAWGFFGWVYWWYDASHAWMWMSGYMLEWMLSFDNLFVFHLIFNVYGTPDNLKHRPLYYGICGAVFFRLVFIFIGEYLMHAMFFMHIVFGAFLIYTGVKTAMTDDEDDDPSEHPLVLFLTTRVPFVNAYDSGGAFFVKVPVNDRGEAMLPEGAIRVATETDSIAAAASAEKGKQGKEGVAKYGTLDLSTIPAKPGIKTQWKATMLFLVVCCLEISDLLFAVDSVSAIVAQVPDLFLAYTSAVFAMLGLRATFFIIDVLAKLFSLLKYGVAVVLVFIGVKLIASHLFHVNALVTCLILVSSIVLSIVASIIKDKYWPEEEDEEEEAASHHSSPIAQGRAVRG